MSICLKTEDEETIYVSLEEIKEFKTIMTYLNIELKDLNTDNVEIQIEDDIITELPGINFKTIDKILEYVRFELENKDLHLHNKSVWYNNFLTCKDSLLIDIMNACDYLQYNELLEKCCEKLSDDLNKCNSVEDLKIKLKITRDLTKDEEEELVSSVVFNKNE